MKLSTLTNKLKRQSASSILGQGTKEKQLSFSFEFEAKPANTLNFKALIKKALNVGIVGFGISGVVVRIFKSNFNFIVRGIDNQLVLLNDNVAGIETIKAQGS